MTYYIFHMFNLPIPTNGIIFVLTGNDNAHKCKLLIDGLAKECDNPQVDKILDINLERPNTIYNCKVYGKLVYSIIHIQLNIIILSAVHIPAV